ncbi:hypothetical protein BH11MYX4_BH11MYX4_19580 [soil metagenome]
MRLRHRLRLALAAGLVLTGCSALIGVNDIFLDPNASAGDGGIDEASTADRTGQDGGGTDGESCKTDLQTDPKNCGRCGHDCFGGTCNAGTCAAIELASITDAPLYQVVVSAESVFVSTRIALTTQAGGIWRIPKAGGAPQAYVTIRYAEGLAVLGDQLYFVVDDAPANGTTAFGGLYSCPLVGASPCTPKLIAVATNARGVVIDKGTVFYGDDLAGKGLMTYTPGGAPAVFRAGFGFSADYFVDGQQAFYTATITNNPRRAKLIEILPDASTNETYVYENPNASDGTVRGAPTFLLFTAYDDQTTTGGVVRRVPRAGGPAPCDYGANGNKRPYGVFADDKRVYWTNQGEGADPPFTGGSLASCELAGCCTTPDIMWTGDGQPTAVTADLSAVYFVTRGKGSLWKIAKP